MHLGTFQPTRFMSGIRAKLVDTADKVVKKQKEINFKKCVSRAGFKDSDTWKK